MIEITVDMVREWGPCYDPAKVVGEDWTGTVLDVLDLDINSGDKLWVVLRDDLLPKSLLMEFARWAALQRADRWGIPAIVRAYLETGDKHLRGEAINSINNKIDCFIFECMEDDNAWSSAQAAWGAIALDETKYLAGIAATRAADFGANETSRAQVVKLRELIVRDLE